MLSKIKVPELPWLTKKEWAKGFREVGILIYYGWKAKRTYYGQRS